MHFPTSLTRAIFAGSLSIAVLAGCPNAGTAPPLPGDLKFSPSPGASAAAPASSTPGTSGASASPAASTAPGASGAPSSTAPSAAGTQNPAPTGATVLLQGKIYDEEGATVEGATVTVKSLDTRAPFTGTATAQGGNYVVNNVPVGAQIEVSVTKTGWTRRVRVTSLQSDVTTRNTLDFGSAGSSNADDLAGEAFFISNYPEITTATPGASPAKGDKLSYKIRFSETLDADARTEIESAFVLDTSAADTALVPEAIKDDADEAVARVNIEEDSAFLDNQEKVSFTWNADNNEVTVDFDAPLRKLNDDEKSYRFRLMYRAGRDLIEDADGNVLGRVEPGTDVAYFAVKKASLVFENDVANADDRWEETHQQSSSFSVEEDDVKPKLVSIDTATVTRSDHNGNEYTRVDLLFSEPMRVYPDDRGYAQSVVELGNYVFAFADDKDDLDAVDMEDDANDVTASGLTPAQFETQVSNDHDPVIFDDDSDIFIEPSDNDSKVVSIFIEKSQLPTDLEEIKVLVKTAVTDPAGNAMSEENEDSSKRTADNVAIGDL